MTYLHLARNALPVLNRRLTSLHPLVKPLEMLETLQLKELMQIVAAGLAQNLPPCVTTGTLSTKKRRITFWNQFDASNDGVLIRKHFVKQQVSHSAVAELIESLQ
jgi:hypothetical protein